MADLLDDHPNRGENARGQWFKKGVSGNPGGRPKLARAAINAAFLKALSEDFRSHGVNTIARVREEDPSTYVRVIASLLPKEIEIERRESPLEALSDDELAAVVEYVRARILGSGSATDAIAAPGAETPAPVH